MILPEIIIEKMQQKSGVQLRASRDCVILSKAIQEESGLFLSPNTLRRLLGFLASDITPHLSTLNTLAQYLGYHDWNSMMSILNEESNHPGIPVGSRHVLESNEYGTLVLEYRGKGIFVVCKNQ